MAVVVETYPLEHGWHANVHYRGWSFDRGAWSVIDSVGPFASEDQAEAALDALAVVVPAVPMSRGGAC